MKKNCCHTFTVFFCALFHLFATVTSAQEKFPDKILNSFDAWRKGNLQEKLFVHTDKYFYLAGERLWFKIYDLDASFNKLLAISKIAYVEILDRDNHAVLQAKISLDGGVGNGSLFLPGNLKPGIFKFRAYTNWMKNFSADFFFEKNITIINPQKSPGLPVITKSETLNTRFFPEGGRLINGLQSKVAFSLKDQNGKGTDCSGVIINEKNDTVARFASLKSGLGNFILTPSSTHSYKAILTSPDGKSIEKELPAVLENGYTMNLSTTGAGQYKITIRSSDLHAQPVYLFIHTRNSIKLATGAILQNGNADFLIDKNIPGDGISQITIFNPQCEPVCERLFFKYPPEQPSIELSTDKKNYGNREKVTILADPESLPKLSRGNLSISVYKVDSLQIPDPTDINSYIWLESDLADAVETPQYYFNRKDAATETALDNLLLTQQWERFHWQDVLQNKKSQHRYVPEYYGHIVNGKIVNVTNDKPVSYTAGYIAIPGKSIKLRTALSDSAGDIKFELINFYGSKEMVTETDTYRDSNYRVEISSPFSDNYSGKPVPSFLISSSDNTAISDKNIYSQVQNVYAGDKLNQFKKPDLDTIPFYGKPDATYLLDDYTRFSTLEEVLREYVLPVLVRKRDGRFHLPVFNEPNRDVFSDDPLALVDGVPVFDLNRLMTYDPLSIRKLDVITKKYDLGPLFFDGIVSFTTYNGDFGGFEPDPKSTSINYEGLLLERKFYFPSYLSDEEKNSRVPDFRNLLYWSPEINVNKELTSFYSSDIPGKYAITIQGIGADGRPVYKTLFFTVGKQYN
jgi:hypothetical protein